MPEVPELTESTRPKVRAFGPEGYPISLSTLPSPQTERWVARRKAEILAAVRNKILSADEACKRYSISPEEFDAWNRAETLFGMPGLQTLFRGTAANGTT